MKNNTDNEIDAAVQTRSSMVLKVSVQPKVPNIAILKQKTHIFSFSSAVLN